jgi:hypothetical protein
MVGLLFISWLEVPFSFAGLGAFGYAVLVPLAAIVFSKPPELVSSDSPAVEGHHSPPFSPATTPTDATSLPTPGATNRWHAGAVK